MSSKGLDIFAGGSRAHGLGGHSDIHHATVNSCLLLTRPPSPASSSSLSSTFLLLLAHRFPILPRIASNAFHRIIRTYISEGRKRKREEENRGRDRWWTTTDVAWMDFERFDERRVEQSEGVERDRCSLIGGVSAGMVQLPVDRRRP